MVAVPCVTHQSSRNTLANGGQHPSQVALNIPALPSTARCRMAFRNEVVSDDDIDRYNLPFPKGEGRWWTRDAERDYYLWGGRVGNLAYEDSQEGWFYLYINGIVYDIFAQPGNQEKDTKNNETIFYWNKIIQIRPEPGNSELSKVIETLKEALSIFGFDGRTNIYFPKFRVEYNF